MVEPTPFTHVSGYANRFNEMLKYLNKGGDDVEIVTPDSSKDAPSKVFGFNVTNIEGFKLPFYKLVTITFDRKFRALRRMQEYKPDILHVTTPGFFVFQAMFTKYWLKRPLVMSYHTHLPFYGRQYFGFVPGIESIMWFCLKCVHNQADLTLTTSPEMKNELEKNGIDRVSVWQKGIDTTVFHPRFKNADMRSRLTLGNPDDKLLIYVGRLGTEKNILDLKKVIQKAGPKCRLAIVGTGPHEQELREAFKGTNTHFTGMLHGDDLAQAFASADIFVMPSQSETLGFVVLESMASGVPVVGVRAGGVQNLISNGETGFLAKPARNMEEFSKLVRNIVEDDELRETMALAARKEAERWDWESATKHLRETHYSKAKENFEIKNEARAKTLMAKCTFPLRTTWQRLAKLSSTMRRRNLHVKPAPI